MNVFIANFGQENYEWPACLSKGTVATMNEVSGQKLWEAGDREGYIQTRLKERTAAGLVPTRPVAARWFNLMTIVSQTSGDIWIHREKNQLWWTISRSDPPFFEAKTEPVGRKRNVVVCHKPCEPWSDRAKKGNRLDWNALHPRAREFLFTEGTLQQLSADNADYALALIEGDDLSSWHSRPLWLEKAQNKKPGGTVFNARQRAAARMVMTATETAATSNGQQVLRTVKNKDVNFQSKGDFEAYVLQLLTLQDGLCAVTSLPLQFDGEADDIQMLCSLDRIDSAGHYASGNLQIVCRFVNRWKGAEGDLSFRRLIECVRSVAVF